MPGSIQAIERAAAVMRLLGAAGRPLALGEIAAALDLPRPTTHGIVTTLRGQGILEQEARAGRYLIGAGFTGLARPWDRHDVRARAANWADALALITGCAVYLGVIEGDGVGILHHVFRPDDTPQRLRTNTIEPINATAWGKCLLAFAPQAMPATIPLDVRWTGRTLMGSQELSAAVEQIRRTGWADDIGEYEVGEGGLAMPIRTNGGLAIAALGLRGRIEDLFRSDGTPRQRLLTELTSTAREISAAVGDQ